MQTQLGAAPTRPSIPTLEFVAGVDESALLEVNNLAFEHHPDQGNWTHASLEARFASNWFDPTGLLVHVNDCGTMLGFCWTKVHRSPSPPIGEIYVLAVRPTHHGRGLGRSLAEAGLRSLRDRGIERAMLFVDAANTSARELYERLGFTITCTTTAFSAAL
jgi:mycothiol synthase